MKVGSVLGLFPLSKLVSGWTDYYINSKGDVYSTKRSTTPLKVTGSATGSISISPSDGSSTTSVKRENLLRRAKSHKDWEKETAKFPPMPHEEGVPFTTGATKPADVPVAQATTDERHHAANMAEGIAKKGWIIGSVTGESVSMAPEPKVHTTEQSFISEMERLALANPGKQFVAFKIDRAVKAAKIVWE